VYGRWLFGLGYRVGSFPNAGWATCIRDRRPFVVRKFAYGFDKNTKRPLVVTDRAQNGY